MFVLEMFIISGRINWAVPLIVMRLAKIMVFTTGQA